MIELFDTYIYTILFSINKPIYTICFMTITQFMSEWFIIAICLLLLLIKRNKETKYITFNVLFVFILNQTIKIFTARPRPDVIRFVTESGYSFPSAHAMIGLAFYGFAIYLLAKKIKDKKLKLILIISLSLIIFLIGISRVYLGVHYASDVIGGFIIGFIYLICFIQLIYKKNLFKL